MWDSIWRLPAFAKCLYFLSKHNFLVTTEFFLRRKAKSRKQHNTSTACCNSDKENTLMVVEISLAMAVSSSCCERGFSCMGRLKSEYRNSLDVETVDMLMNICLNGSSPIIAERAILHWNQASQRMRRPCLKD